MTIRYKSFSTLLILSILFSVGYSFRVGTFSTVITPTVNGTTDYVQPVSEFDAESPGTFVYQFDDGAIPIGNGQSSSNWVRDHVKTTSMAIEDLNGDIILFSTTDVYMLFQNDLEGYYSRVRSLVGEETYKRIKFVVSSTHNHHGPDTTGLSGLNRKWYEKMLNKMAETTMESILRLQPATISISDSNWMFGLGDARDPLVVDPTLNVLQAKTMVGQVIGTIVSWGFHPEVTLGFGPTVPKEDCDALGQSYPCSAKGRYISADIVGYLRNRIKEKVGGDTLFLNGAIGVQVGPHGPVWEVSPQYPITGDGSVPPPGSTLLKRNFRFAYLVGTELANQALLTLESPRAVILKDEPIYYKSKNFYTYLPNPFFRAGTSPNPENPSIPYAIGYSLRELYICKNGVTPSDETCVFDNYETVVDIGPFYVPYRKGSYLKTSIIHLQVGPLKMVTIPGELAPELSNGLPEDFDNPESYNKYYRSFDLHPIGENYTTPGVLKDMMKCNYCWTTGLTVDAIGYLFPISDWRLACEGPNCDGDGYNTGTTCKKLVEEGTPIGKISCIYGQIGISSMKEHFEEVVSTSWDVALDYLQNAGELLGVPITGRYTKQRWDQ